MPSITPTYKLEYFKQGSYYSAASDKRRFLTLDYNMKSYVGVIGNGIITGWTIEQLSGLNFQIIPGTGIINGFYAESPYIVKQRSDMVSGDREVDVIPDQNGIPEVDLTPSQRAIYVSVIQEYNPSYNPTGNIENAFVKIVIPTVISDTNLPPLKLSDNTDNYIYAKMKNDKPYPLLGDLDALIKSLGEPPKRSDYTTYDSYKVVLDAYNAKLKVIHNYEWYTNPVNHFTEVDFEVLTYYTKSSSKILLGRVVTRSGNITTIDVSAVEYLENLYSQIKKYALDYVVGHHHGGSKSYDPPKIRLETDIRNTVLNSYNQSSGKAIFNVLEKDETGITLGHTHTYKIDENGNGVTLEQTGSTNLHYHNISLLVVGSPSGNVDYVQDHTHTVLSSSDQGDTWNADSKYIIYVNDVTFADETSTNVIADYIDKTIAIYMTNNSGISASYKTYSCSFPIFNTTYSFTAKCISVYRFMIDMSIDFDKKFLKDVTSNQDSESQEAIAQENALQASMEASPFIFFDEDGNILGNTDLKNQCQAATFILKDNGDQFIFTPNAAKNITITLVDGGDLVSVDDVKIEILGNTEVKGVLSLDNILYVNVDKILTGEFSPQVIPFISHVGRLYEEFLPNQYSLVSDDGIRYMVTPSLTGYELGHAHKLLLDKNGDGTTSDVLIDNEPVYYAYDQNNVSYFITHYHGVVADIVSSVGSNGLGDWQNTVSSNLTSSIHTHNVIFPIPGNNKTIYCIKEDSSGNIYTGTSDGLMIIPSYLSYLITINNNEYYFYGNDLWSILQSAKSQYEKETDNPLLFDDNISESSMQEIQSLLNNDGESSILYNNSSPSREQDIIMIKKISSFNIPNFKYVQEKNEFEVMDNEVIIDEDSEGNVTVEKQLNDIPIWSIDLRSVTSASAAYISSVVSTDMLAVGSNLIVKNIGIDKDIYGTWNNVDIPFSVGVIRKAIRSSNGDYWFNSNNGLLVARSCTNGDIIEVVNLPLTDPDIKDIVEGEKDVIYGVSASGVFKTLDGGKSWSKILDVVNGFKQIVRDYTLDKSNIVNDHYHYLDVSDDGNGFLTESIGSGIQHVHIVNLWNIENTLNHSHTLIVTLYVVDNNGDIWKSIDNGSNWVNYKDMPMGECGDIFACFSKLFVSKSDGLYSSDGDWTKILDAQVYSYAMGYNRYEMLVGTNNIIYRTMDGLTFDKIYEFSGSPSVTLIENGNRKYYGYAYNNQSKTFHFKDILVTDDNISALIDFGKWYAEEGSWNSDAPYDIYIENKLVLSTKYNKDKRDLLGYSFAVNPPMGNIDFDVSSVVSSVVNVFDETIVLNDTTGFIAGDEIVIRSFIDNNVSSNVSTSNVSSNVSTSNSSSINIDGLPDSQLENTFAFIREVTDGELMLTSRVSKEIKLPAKAYKVSPLNGNSNLLVNIYDSILGNIGEFTHEQVEDKLSYFSDGRPFKFNDAYLSNLLQLTQAVRYSYPTINDEMINNLFYDFRYNWTPSDPYYIGNFIDIDTTEIYNQSIYSDQFTIQKSMSINKILVGYGNFSGTIIVATDIGLFWAKYESNWEANWFHIGSLPYSVYDIVIFNEGTKILAATSNGTYNSTDMESWSLELSPTVNYPSYALGLRWQDQDIITISSHDAYFASNDDNTGTITTTYGIYSSLKINQGIKITNAGDKNGKYIIKTINEDESQLTVSPSFSGPNETKTGITIIMSNWWKYWLGDDNQFNPEITNTLLIGGDSHISYNDGNNTWYESKFDISNFVVNKFLSATVGNILAIATGNTSLDKKNYLLNSNDIGRNWSVLKEWDEITGFIYYSSVSDFDNTVLKVSYENPQNFIYVNGVLDQLSISIFKGDSDVASFTGKVVWNERKDSDIITVYGNVANSIIGNDNDYRFIIYPSKINTMVETSQNSVLFGTDRGIYWDVDSIVSNLPIEGTVLSSGIGGIVTKIDIAGNIISIGYNDISGNSILSVTLNSTVRKDELKDKALYVTDKDPVEKYSIITNSSVNLGNQLTIEIEGRLASTYIGKKITITGSGSRVYVTFDSYVKNNDLAGGTLNTLVLVKGKFEVQKYNIKSNGTDYVDLETLFVPESTLITRIENAVYVAPLIDIGDDVKFIDKSGKLTVWIAIDTIVKENALANLYFDLIPSSIVPVSIYSNLNNAVVLNTNNPFTITNGDQFQIKGTLFEKLPSFSSKETSIESDHYHDIEMVDNVVSGKILSFGYTDSSYVDINVTDASNFDIPIVQFRGDLFKGAKIIFTNNESFTQRYISEVVSHTSSSIRVLLKSSSYWDISGYNVLKVSEGWKWEIDGTNYGYANDIYYNDFVVINKFVLDNLLRNNDTIELDSTAGININDKIRIQDDTSSYEINYVKQILSATQIKVVNGFSRSFLLTHNVQMKVLRDSFTNTHTHQIRNNELEIIGVSEYLDRGYSFNHSHRVLSLISDVSTLLNENSSIIAAGSGSILYSSGNNGSTWVEKVNLNRFLEGSMEEINGVSSGIINNNQIVVGVTNGFLFVETDKNNDVVAIQNPL